MSRSRRYAIGAIAGLVLLPLGAGPAWSRRRDRARGDEVQRDDDDDDHAAAARARAAGEILPLTEILDHVRLTHPGEVVGIELDREKGRWVYEIKLIRPDGRFVKIYIDARDKRTLKVEAK